MHYNIVICSNRVISDKVSNQVISISVWCKVTYILYASSWEVMCKAYCASAAVSCIVVSGCFEIMIVCYGCVHSVFIK